MNTVSTAPVRLATAKKAGLRNFRKYPNRRLYDLEASCYVGLAEVLAEVRRGFEVQVIDKRTGEDITTRILMDAVLQDATSFSTLTSKRAHEIARTGL